MATGGWDHVTQSDAERMNRARTPTLRPVKADLRTDVPAVTRTRSKYRNVPTTVAGIRFDSAKEVNRYLYLKNLEDIGGSNSYSSKRAGKFTSTAEMAVAAT